MTSGAKSPASLKRAEIVILLLMFIAGIAVLLHHLPSSVPDIRPDKNMMPPIKELERKSASAEALRSMIELITTVSLGLGAVVGVGIKDGLGKDNTIRIVNHLLLSAFFLCLLIVFKYAYASYGALAAQLDQGYLFIARIQDLLDPQVYATSAAATFTIAILYFNLLSKP